MFLNVAFMSSVPAQLCKGDDVNGMEIRVWLAGILTNFQSFVTLQTGVKMQA